MIIGNHLMIELQKDTQPVFKSKPGRRSKNEPKEDPNEKKIRSLERNREAAMRCRTKLKPYDDDAEDPAAAPIFWISKWVDYTDKYGVGYQLCDNSVGSLMEMSKRRKVLTEPEIRYMVKQIAQACDYLHGLKIIHRDLKLGNLFLNDNMELKVGDFGLATKVQTSGERKLTLCGTPNYIAPEVLLKKGHSYEVDIWSLGCIVYTLIVGKPPFETNDLKDTYKRIRYNTYTFPNNINEEIKIFIQKMLQSNPKDRPSMKDVLNDPYMKNYTPSSLPVSCLTMAPRLNNGRLSVMPSDILSPRKPLVEKLQDTKVDEKAKFTDENEIESHPEKIETNPIVKLHRPESSLNINGVKDLFIQLRNLLSSKIEVKPYDDDAEDPAAAPIFWISKWVDYTDKYGVGYQLCDNSVGVFFNDATRIVLLADGHNLQYIEKDGTESFFTFDRFPDFLYKKITLLKYFRNYMNEHLLKLEKANDNGEVRKEDVITRLPYLNNWFRTRSAIVFHLTNDTVQINFFQDHTKLILCPHMGAVTYINESRDFRTFKFNLIKKFGCSEAVAERLKFARDVVQKLLTHKAGPRSKR
ncbi:hypothetical protein RND71_043389 [Anisodus tanguticus]|uniref:Polo kinase n=1 Tax=Anisodus tanguticus TaxID=243964 RepID=A0AAE1QNV5_9SOLA|nr:hypothetical protein RND71_043389 [Anisodus tanguticus]